QARLAGVFVLAEPFPEAALIRPDDLGRAHQGDDQHDRHGDQQDHDHGHQVPPSSVSGSTTTRVPRTSSTRTLVPDAMTASTSLIARHSSLWMRTRPRRSTSSISIAAMTMPVRPINRSAPTPVVLGASLTNLRAHR